LLRALDRGAERAGVLKRTRVDEFPRQQLRDYKETLLVDGTLEVRFPRERSSVVDSEHCQNGVAGHRSLLMRVPQVGCGGWLSNPALC
jgi:hypothetical protein